MESGSELNGGQSEKGVVLPPWMCWSEDRTIPDFLSGVYARKSKIDGVIKIGLEILIHVSEFLQSGQVVLIDSDVVASEDCVVNVVVTT